VHAREKDTETEKKRGKKSKRARARETEREREREGERERAREKERQKDRETADDTTTRGNNASKPIVVARNLSCVCVRAFVCARLCQNVCIHGYIHVLAWETKKTEGKTTSAQQKGEPERQEGKRVVLSTRLTLCREKYRIDAYGIFEPPPRLQHT